MEKRFGWKTEPTLVQVVADLVQGTFAPILAFSEPGDGVILQVPAYPPFREAITATKRALVALTMRDDGTRYVFDVAELAGRIDARTRILIVCNPQNPTGARVRARRIVGARADWRSSMTSSSSPTKSTRTSSSTAASISRWPRSAPEIAARTVTITSATKSFNIPGLRCGVMHFGTSELRRRFAQAHPVAPHRRLQRARHRRDGRRLDVRATPGSTPSSRILRRRATASSRRSGPELPQVRCHAPEGTYLAWLDFRELRLKHAAPSSSSTIRRASR